MSLLGWRDRALLTAPFLALLFLAVASPSDDGPTFCPFALCTGTACPGCGMTRAASHLIRGDIGAAFSYHPLVLLVGIEAAAAWVWFVLRRLGKVGPMSSRTLNLVLIGTVISLIAVWVARMATGSLPPV